jgi:hypothetical protein
MAFHFQFDVTHLHTHARRHFYAFEPASVQAEAVTAAEVDQCIAMFRPYEFGVFP